MSGGPDRPAPTETTAPTLAPPGFRTLTEEVLLVLSLSLLPSAIDAVLSYFQAPVNRGVAVTLYPSFPSFPFLREFLAILFSIPPAWLVVHLARRSGEGLGPFGLGLGTLRQDVAWGAAAAAAVAAVGLGVYLAAIALNVNRFVVPVPPLGHWWTIPILVLGALQTALLEEIVVLAYLVRRLEQLGLRTIAAVVASAVLRGSYHLYQGWGGFTGNLVLGLAFGYAYARWRRTWPLITAHFIVDTLAGLAYIMFRGHCFGSLCIPK